MRSIATKIYYLALLVLGAKAGVQNGLTPDYLYALNVHVQAASHHAGAHLATWLYKRYA